MPILAACVIPPKVAILTEFFTFGDAYQFLHDASLELSPAQAMKMATDVAKGEANYPIAWNSLTPCIAAGLLFLHEQNPPLYHHNLRAQNVMVGLSSSNNHRPF